MEALHGVATTTFGADASKDRDNQKDEKSNGGSSNKKCIHLTPYTRRGDLEFDLD